MEKQTFIKQKRYRTDDNEIKKFTTCKIKNVDRTLLHESGEENDIITTAQIFNPNKMSTKEKNNINKTTDLTIENTPFCKNDVINNNYIILDIFLANKNSIVYKVQNKSNKIFYAMNIIYKKDKVIELITDKHIINKSFKEKGNTAYLIKVYDTFNFKKENNEYIAIVMELEDLGFKSKINYKNYSANKLSNIQKFAFKIFSVLYLIQNNEPRGYNKNIEQIIYSTINSKLSLLKKNELKINEEEINIKNMNLIGVNFKLIDFGTSTERNDKNISDALKSKRPPECILTSEDWDIYGYIWSIGCFLFEIYTGEVLFPSKTEEEHLYFISKLCGHFPKDLINKCSNKKLKEFFKKCEKGNNDYEFNIDACINKEDMERNFSKHCSFYEKFCERDLILADFIKFLLRIDRFYRPTLVKIFNHEFFQYNFE